ncbi:MAG: metallophosphoesterase [FCB group bacterium]|nr:metallophosphoesterase [FCB group bacterium]
MRDLLKVVVAVGLVCLTGLAVAHDTEKAGFTSDVDTEAKPWTSDDLNNDPNAFRFAIVSDNTGGPREGIFVEAVEKLNLMQPEFVIGTGDYIEGYEDTREQIDAQREHHMKQVANLEIPMFFVPGNHDVGRPMWAESYKARFGKTYFHIIYKDVLFLCLNTNDGPECGTGISPEQVEYAKRVLSENANVRWTFVMQHKPLWNDDNAEWKQIEEALKGRNVTVFAGHTHNYLSQENHGIQFITQATTGGGTMLRGPELGEFDHMVWVTVTAKGPKIANLALDGILAHDFRTPQQAKEYAGFSFDRAVMATPIALEAGPFQRGTSTVKITNPSDKPLRVKVLSEAQAGVRVEPSSITVVVPGKSEHTAELAISADVPVAMPQMQPIVLHWTAAYDNSGNKPSTTFSGERSIPVDAPYAIPVAAAAPVIDGKLDEWADLPFLVNQPAQVWHNRPAWKGPQDGAYRFGVSRDDKFVYVAVKTTDDQSCFDGWKYWEDFVAVFVDARASEKDDPKTAVFNVFAGPEMNMEQADEFTMGKAPEGILTASVPTEDGFAAEFAIPVAYLNERQGGDWKQCRLNVAFGDFDRNDMRDGVSLLYWRPEWDKGSVPAAVFTK